MTINKSKSYNRKDNSFSNELKNLLVITTRYPHKHDQISSVFIHSQIQELKRYFDRVVIISTTPYIPKIFTRWMQPRHRFDSLAEDYNYDNVEVYFTGNIMSSMATIVKSLRGWQGYRAAKRILERIGFEPDIIHSHFSWPSGYIALKLKEEMKAPMIITVHENHDWFIEETKNKKIQEVWERSDSIIRVNKMDVPELKRFNANTRSIPNGYLHEKFKPMDKKVCRKRWDFPNEKNVVFSLGSLNERKGFHDLVEAARLVSRKRTDFILAIGGDGPLRDRLEFMINENGLSNNVRLLGYVAEEDVPVLMNAADFFVLPSYSEGNPTVMFEALGCGTPFVGTNVGGIPEIITDDRVGLLVSPGNPEELAHIIEQALDYDWDTEYILSYAKQFTWANIAEEIIDVYKEVINGFNPNRGFQTIK